MIKMNRLAGLASGRTGCSKGQEKAQIPRL